MKKIISTETPKADTDDKKVSQPSSPKETKTAMKKLSSAKAGKANGDTIEPN